MKIFIKIVITLTIIILMPFVVNFIYYRFIKKIKPIPLLFKREKRKSLLRKIVFDLPERFILDKLTFDPNTFPYKGVWIIHGKQGKGKTITTTYLLRELKKEYPLVKIKTNFDYKHQDEPLEHWKSMVFSNNGIYGEIDVLDEIQNWFNSMESKNFPPEMLTEISQQRKQRKVIIGTSQLFTRIAKPIREQTYLLFTPTTLFGCFTIVKVSEPQFNENAEMVKERFIKLFCFVQDADLRDSFDTYKKIKRLSSKGFKDESEQIRVNPSASTTNILIEDISNKKGGHK